VDVLKNIVEPGLLEKDPEKFLKIKAWELRWEIIDMIYHGGSGHPGGSLSAAEIVSVLYWKVLNTDSKNPKWEQRDRLVLSKGHTCPVVYAALTHKGFFDREELKTLRRLGSRLQGHPDARKTPGIEMSTGSLGQGLSLALGLALGAKQIKASWRVYTLMSDGETQEGMVWEAAMAAAHHKAGNLTAIIDYNNLQVDGHINEIMNFEPYAAKWQAFGWQVQEADGNDVSSLLSAFEARRNTEYPDKPHVVICKTVKGKGVTYMEDVKEWHASPISKEQRAQAIAEIEAEIEKLRA
jgi:transketolase